MKAGSDDAPRLLGYIFRNYLPSILGLVFFFSLKEISLFIRIFFFLSHEHVQVFKVKL